MCRKLMNLELGMSPEGRAFHGLIQQPDGITAFWRAGLPQMAPLNMS